MEQPRIVVFTGDLNYSVSKGIVEIDRSMAGLTWLIVIHAPRRSPAQLLHNQFRNLRRNGWRWIPYQAGEILRSMWTAKPMRFPDPRFPGSAYHDLRTSGNVTVVRVNDIHTPSTLEQVRAFAPDLGLSLAAPILKRDLFDIPRLGTINLHKGKLPDYRGMPPAFWELSNDEQSIGCTVHFVDDKLDTGDIIAQSTLPRAKFATLRGLQLLLDEEGVVLMREAVESILRGTARRTAQGSGGRTYRKPTLAQVAALERKQRASNPSDGSRARHALKQLRARAGFAAWRLGMGKVVSPRVTVLLYHRVSDDVRDNLSVGIEQFDRQIRLLRRHCEILPIEDVIAMQEIPRSDRPLVAITFDDGYLDNYAHAAPILLRNNAPAAFFVSTGIISSNGRFPHDLRRGNPHIPIMTWDELRRMRDWGFTLGSHSVSHIDCAAESESTVRFELQQSRDDLHRELGISEPIFAYPYGGRNHMTPERLELVKQVGYVACLSAYGGSNVGRVDRYNVLRRGIHWQFTDEAVLFAALGID